MLDGRADPGRARVSRVLTFEPKEPAPENWADHLALWAQLHQEREGALPLDRCVVDLATPGADGRPAAGRPRDGGARRHHSLHAAGRHLPQQQRGPPAAGDRSSATARAHWSRPPSVSPPRAARSTSGNSLTQDLRTEQPAATAGTSHDRSVAYTQRAARSKKLRPTRSRSDLGSSTWNPEQLKVSSLRSRCFSGSEVCVSAGQV